MHCDHSRSQRPPTAPWPVFPAQQFSRAQHKDRALVSTTLSTHHKRIALCSRWADRPQRAGDPSARATGPTPQYSGSHLPLSADARPRAPLDAYAARRHTQGRAPVCVAMLALPLKRCEAARARRSCTAPPTSRRLTCLGSSPAEGLPHAPPPSTHPPARAHGILSRASRQFATAPCAGRGARPGRLRVCYGAARLSCRRARCTGSPCSCG